MCYIFANKFVKPDCHVLERISRVLTPHKMTNQIIAITLNIDYDTLGERTCRFTKRKREGEREERDRAARIGRVTDELRGPSERFLAFGKSQIELSSQPTRYPRNVVDV